MSAKGKEVAALQTSIEVKLARVGDLGVGIATMTNDHEDTVEALRDDKKFRADLEKNCAQREKVHEEEMNLRAQETLALADTIKVLNDDDALELFKKTLPSGSASLMQVQEGSSALRARAREALTKSSSQLKPGERSGLDFILLALRGEKIGFDKVIKLIDDLVATLKQEQLDDDNKREYCAFELDKTDDRRKQLEDTIADLATLIDESEEAIAKLAAEIQALKSSIAALDKSVAQATEQRQAENAEFKDLMSSNSASKDVILFAKNRMNKFYNPKLYKAPPKRDLSEGDQIYVNTGGDIPTEAPGGIANTGITALVQLASHKAAPGPPPEVAAAYTKKSGEKGGVIAMMDLLVADLDKEMNEAKVEEKNAQEEYEQTMSDSADKRRQDSKSLTDKESAKADLTSSLEQSQGEKKSTEKKHMDTMRYLGNLHSECDWLLKYFEVRKTSRADEMDALGNAKAVLNGADYSFLQREVSARSHKFLRRVA